MKNQSRKTMKWNKMLCDKIERKKHIKNNNQENEYHIWYKKQNKIKWKINKIEKKNNLKNNPKQRNFNQKKKGSLL